MRTDTVLIPVIDGDLADTTRAIDFPWLRPPVTSRHLTSRGRLAHRWQLVCASRFAVVIAFVVIVHGAYVAAELVGVVR